MKVSFHSLLSLALLSPGLFHLTNTLAYPAVSGSRVAVPVACPSALQKESQTLSRRQDFTGIINHFVS